MFKNTTFNYDIYEAILSLENMVINKYGIKEEYIEPLYTYFSKLLCVFYRDYKDIDKKSKEITAIIYSVSLYIFNLKRESISSEKMYEVLIHATAYEIRNMIDNKKLEFPEIVNDFYKTLDDVEQELYKFIFSYKLSGCENELGYELTKMLILKDLHLTTSQYQINVLMTKKKEIDYGIVDENINDEFEAKLDNYIKELVSSSIPVKKRFI